MTQFSAWDNGKAGLRFTIQKGDKVFVANSDGTWDYVCSKYEIDSNWMNKNQTPVAFKDLPLAVQNEVEFMISTPMNTLDMSISL